MNNVKNRVKAFYESHKYEVITTAACAVVTTFAVLEAKKAQGLDPVMAATMHQVEGDPHVCVLLKNGNHRDFPVFNIHPNE